MSKIYQCDKPGMNLSRDNNDNPWTQETNPKKQRVIAGAGVIAFHPVPDEFKPGIIYGECASDNPIFAKRFQIVTARDADNRVVGTRDCTSEEIEDIIESSKAFKDCQDHGTMGVRGIWVKEDLIAKYRAELGMSTGVSASSVYDKMSDDVLKLHISTEGGKYPAEADHATLVKIATELEPR